MAAAVRELAAHKWRGRNAKRKYIHIIYIINKIMMSISCTPALFALQMKEK